jgi:formylglycine-generating enzyme required for sulfatase activity
LESRYLGADFKFNYCEGRWVLQTEVIQKQWDAVVAAGELKENPSYFRGDNHPVTNVTPEDVEQFCRILKNLSGYPIRLMTEAEWNRAALAGAKIPSRYRSDPLHNPTADEVEKFAWFSGNSGNSTHPVRGFAANAWGLYDMMGNAAELVVTPSGNYRFMGGWYCADALWCKPSYYGTWTKRESGVGFRICFEP